MTSHRVEGNLTGLDVAAAQGDPNRRVVYDVPSWWRSNDRTRVRFLRQMAEGDGNSPELREFVVTQVLMPAGAEPHDHRAQAAALLAWVQHRTYYVTEPGEQVQTVSYTLRKGFGDCDDQALLLAAMAHSIGLPFRFCLAGQMPGKQGLVRWCEGDRWPRGMQPTHIYVQIGTPALSSNPTWHSAEPTIQGLPLGHDVVLHGMPGGGAGRTDLGGGTAGLAGYGTVVEGSTEIAPAVHDTRPVPFTASGWFRDNVDLGRVMAGVIEGTLTAVAIAYVGGKLVKK